MTFTTSKRLPSAVLTGAVSFALALAIGWTPNHVAAQSAGTLVGTVTDAASQRPLEAAQVYIPGTGIGALTNAAGRFLLLNVPAGEYTLTAELVGYRSGEQTVTVGAGQSVQIDIGLAHRLRSLWTRSWSPVLESPLRNVSSVTRSRRSTLDRRSRMLRSRTSHS